MRNREWGIRVGPPVKCRRGFIQLPLGFWALILSFGMLWTMIIDWGTRDPSPVEYRDEQFDPGSM